MPIKASIFQRLALGEITREQYDQANRRAHETWDKHGFPRQRINGTNCIPGGALGQKFFEIRDFYVNHPEAA